MAAKLNRLKRKIFPIIAIVLGLVATLFSTHWYWLNKGTNDIATQSEKQLNELVLFIEQELSQFEIIPEVIASNPILQQGLLAQHDSEVMAKLNNYLFELQQVTEASDIYLTDALGVAIAASNWQKSNIFRLAFIHFEFHSIPVADQYGPVFFNSYS